MSMFRAHATLQGIPCHADTVLKIDVKAQKVLTVGGPLPGGKARPDGKYKYLGGELAVVKKKTQINERPKLEIKVLTAGPPAI